MSLAVDIDQEQLAAFCRRWKVKEFSLFGSVLRHDFRADSDVDVLVDFTEDADWSLLDIVAMKQELEAAFGRHVDLLTRRAVEQSPNWIRRRAILDSKERIYAG